MILKEIANWNLDILLHMSFLSVAPYASEDLGGWADKFCFHLNRK